MAAYGEIVNLVTARTGLRGDAASGRMTGLYNGYTVLAEPIGNTVNYMIKIGARGANGAVMDSGTAKQIAKGSPAVAAIQIQNFQWNVTVKNRIGAAKTADGICEALQYITNALQSYQQISVCGRCGQVKPTEGVIIGNNSAVLCEDCYKAEQAAGAARQQALDAKPENVVGGIVGALLGSLVGVLAIVLIGQLGYVSALSGIVMGVCALKGYELLGGKLTKRGIIISVIVMIFMVYVGNRLDWAISLQREIYTDDTVFTVFRYLDEGLEQLRANGADVSGYTTNLLMQYGFSALGAASMIVTAVKNAKNANKTARI
ncbi:MAG: hypothetical protein E7240_07225 [Lachnospiraceae bacterium]|nr:hypothetical protein [Lachnospiraceae bacterium]